MKDTTYDECDSELIFLTECPHHCSLCWNETECYECTHGYFLDTSGLCERKYPKHLDCTYL